MAVINLGNLKFTWKGVWATNTPYAKDDIVKYGGSAYVCVTAHTSGLTYAANSSKFELMAAGVEYAGVYNLSVLYQTNDIVSYGGATYIALQESTGQLPGSSPTYWSGLVGGIQFIGTYSNATSYTKGDIVSYGGNTYISKTNTTNNPPTNGAYWSLFNQGFALIGVYDSGIEYKIGEIVTFGANAYVCILNTTAGISPTNATNWTKLTSGFSSQGIYSSIATYKPGDVVQYGGYLYTCILGTVGNAPTNTGFWTQTATGFKWSGTYSSLTTYQKGEVVNYNGSSFVAISNDVLNAQPDISSTQWTLMMQGSANNVYTTAGDIAYRNNSAIVRLPAGTSGQVLTIDNTTGLPIWENNGYASNVYYVSQNGVDAANYGTTLERPFATLQYATQHVITPCTIFVKAGSYYETLPITVPANCAIIGDSLRTTFVYPKPNTVVTATYNPTGSSGKTLKVNSTTGIVAGMVVSGTGFTSGQTVSTVDSPTQVTLGANPDSTPSGTLTFTQYNLSLDNTPVANNLSTMFLVGDSTAIKQITVKGMTGFSPSNSNIQDITTATIGGVFIRLNPASPISNRSPYIADVTAISTGGTGVIVDGSVHATGNKSMVFHAFTIVTDNGVGYWVSNNAKAELVSCFTYYAYFGYAVSGGGKIRSLSGNNSYGTFGVVARGYDVTETPLTATIYGNQLAYNSNSLSGYGFTNGEVVTGLTSGARGTITNVQSGAYKIYYKTISGTFVSGETFVGATSGTSAVIASGGVTGQKGFVLVVSGLTSQPIIGTSIEMDGDTSAYVIQQIGTWVNASSVVQIVLAQEKVVASVDGTAIRIRANFSNARLTGHDFLNVGTGGVTTTNYPGYPLQSAAPGNQTIEAFPGRVFYVSTDQDGNFKVGNYFAVNQATGTATLNANAFNLSGLSALRLGSIGAQLGELISEFSSDVTLGADSNSKVPTQHAVKAYVDAKTGQASQIIQGDSSVIISDSGPNGSITMAADGVNQIVVTNGKVSLPQATASTSAVTGALVVVGGVGIGGNLNVSSNALVSGTLTVGGNLTVNGTTTTVNSTSLLIEDKLIEIAYGAGATGVTGTISGTSTTTTITGLSSTSGIIPGALLTKTSGTGAFGGTTSVVSVDSTTQITISSATANTAGNVVFNVGGSTDATANGGGLKIYGTTNKTLLWNSSTGNFTSNVGLDVTGALTASSGISNTAISGSTGSFTTLSASSTVTLSPSNNSVTISPTGTGTLTINPNTTGAIDKVNIGANSPGTGKFAGLTVTTSASFTTDALPTTDATYNLGSASFRWKNVYTTDLHLSNESKPEGNSVDGTTGNWTIQEGENDLYLLNNKTGKKYKFIIQEV